MTNEGKSFVLLGTGELARYIRPCLKILAGNKINECVGIHRNTSSIKNDPTLFDFKICCDDVYTTLLEKKPEVIVVAIPPSAVKEVISTSVKKYFQYLDKSEQERPFIISFAPSPENSYYTDKLGSCKCVNILPNMIRDINGVNCSSIGKNYATVSEKGSWTEADFDMLKNFMNPCGEILYTEQQEVYGLLAGKCVGNLLLNIADKLDSDLQYSAKVMRVALHSFYDQDIALDSPIIDDRNENLNSMIRDAFCSWYDGIIKSLNDIGINRKLAIKGTSFKLELYLKSIETEDIEKIYLSNKSHRTVGGVQEFADITFEKHSEKKINDCLSQKNIQEIRKTLFSESDYITSVTAEFCSHLSEERNG